MVQLHRANGALAYCAILQTPGPGPLMTRIGLDTRGIGSFRVPPAMLARVGLRHAGLALIGHNNSVVEARRGLFFWTRHNPEILQCSPSRPYRGDGADLAPAEVFGQLD